MPTSTVRFVGRQPILDAQQRLFGYELLFRSGSENCFSGDAEMATRQMIDNVLVLGIDTIAPGGKAFINCTREALVDRLVTSMPPAATVLEVLEGIEVDDEVVAACEELSRLGYGIALDDYVPGTSADRLLHLADYIKLDLQALTKEQVSEAKCSLANSRARLIAEKVETAAEFHRALAEGFEYFQGYFFCRPVISEHRQIPQNHIVYLQLISALNREYSDLREIERLVTSDASLCFRVLRMVNSAAMPIRQHITSIRQALLMIGVNELRKLVTLVGAANLASSRGSRQGALPALMLHAFQRARFGEMMAASAGQLSGEQFLLGLLSHFDAILEVPMAQIVPLVPLSAKASAALTGEENEVGLPMRIMKYYEQRDWEACARLCRPLHVSESELESIYVSSLRWATTEMRHAEMQA